MNKSLLKCGIIQHSNVVNVEQNIEKISAQITACAQAGAELICLQELHNSLYFCQTEDTSCFDLAESIPGPSTALYGSLAQKLQVIIVLSLFEKRAPGIYHNTAVVIEKNGEITGKYRKMHIPDDPAYYEKFYFTPGDLGFEPIQCSIGKIGVLVCWDQWFPEAARIMAMKGAELLIYPTAIGWDPNDTNEEKKRQQEAWITIQRSHAIANGIPVIVTNRVGHEIAPEGSLGSGNTFWGASFVAGPQGEIIFQASSQVEETAVIEIDRARTESVRRIWPYFRDRRIDAYNDIVKRYCD